MALLESPGTDLRFVFVELAIKQGGFSRFR